MAVSAPPVITSLALLHFDGTDGAATYFDEYGNTWTASGSFTPVIDDSKDKFGTACLEMLWGTSAGQIETTIAGIDNESDLTLSFWYWHDAAGGALLGSTRFLFEIETDDKIYRLENTNAGGIGPVILYDFTNDDDTAATNMPNDQWVWYQFIRQGTTASLYTGTSGTATLLCQVVGPAPTPATANVRIQLSNTFPTMNGWIDEVRFANTADTDHTVPVAPYSPP